MPVMLVTSGAFELRAHIADVARRFAHCGYFAVAPDPMARQGDPMRYGNVSKLVKELPQPGQARPARHQACDL